MDNIFNFEWDTEKAVRNNAKHNVRFEEAANVFLDPFAIEEFDDRKEYDEERFIRIGIVGKRLLTVVYTERNEYIRIISAREATKHEKNYYYSQNMA